MRVKSECLQCSVSFYYNTNASTGKYCSNKCQAEARHLLLLKEWKAGNLPACNKGGQLRSGIKEWVKQRDGHKCVLCGWSEKNPVTGRSPLEVDHSDGDHTNNAASNLRTLCPNCHSLTPTWKNTGNRKCAQRGRTYRRKC